MRILVCLFFRREEEKSTEENRERKLISKINHKRGEWTEKFEDKKNSFLGISKSENYKYAVYIMLENTGLK